MENQTFEVKKDCFAYSTENNRCSVLRDTYCKKENCKFYKPSRKRGDKKDGR